ncbi:endoglucanase [Tricholoma matsutake]|nr:endoglucanase [Tricholoma matsutake 945]
MKSSLALAFVAVLLALSSPALAVVPVWGQCGGQGYSGQTTCASGSSCVASTQYYSQCLPDSGSTTVSPSTMLAPSTTTTSAVPTSSTCSATRTKFKYFGVNESGAEFAPNALPGTAGTDYAFPAPSSIDFFVSQGFNTFRVPFLMERLSPPATGLTGAFNQPYLSGLTTIVDYITSKGAFAIIDPHNYMRYNGQVITSTSDFQTCPNPSSSSAIWLMRAFTDVMNEPNGIPAQNVLSLNQAAINGIRACGATSQLILAEAWTGAWSWTTSGNTVFAQITDPHNNTAIQMHQYLDSDASGTSGTCVSPTIGAERLQAATSWLQANNLKGFLGEMGGGSNDVCVSAVYGAICAMQESGVWIGFTWWAAGPFWGNYFTSIEPPSGAAIALILPQALKPFL